MQTKKTFASGFALIAKALVAFTVTDDGIVRSVHGAPLEVDPSTETFYTRNSVFSAALKAGHNRSDHLSLAKILPSADYKLEARDLYAHIAHMATNGGRVSGTGRAIDLISKVVVAYAEEQPAAIVAA